MDSDSEDLPDGESDLFSIRLSTTEIMKLLVELIKDPDSSLLIHRHLCLLENFFIESNEKIMIGDLPYVSVVLDYLCCLGDEIPEYKSPLLHLLYVLSNPPYLSKMSDSLCCKRILRNYFNILGGLLLKLIARPFLHKCILSIIHNLLTREKSEDNSIVHPELCIEGLQTSDLCVHLSEFISLKNYFNMEETLTVVEDIVLLSQNCCLRFLSCYLHETLLLQIIQDHKDFNMKSNWELQDSIICILWVLLRCYHLNHKREKLSIKSPSNKSVRNLIQLLKYETTNANQSLDTKFHRNNIALMIMELVYLFPETELETNYVLDDITLFASMSDENNSTDSCKAILLTNSEEDYKFKKIMIMTACLAVINSSNREGAEMKTEKLMATLLDFLSPWNNPITTVQWDKIQTADFLKFSLKVIPLLLPVHAVKFVVADGIIRMMDVLELFKYDTIHIEILQWLVKSLNRIYEFFHKKEVKAGSDFSIINKVWENTKQSLIIGLCKRILNTDTLSLAFQQILTHLLCILQLLMENMENSCFDHQNLLELAHNCLERINSPKEGDSLISNRLVTAIADFVWSFITCSSDNCKKFIQKNGVYKILDTLQECEFPIKLIFLATLVDMCEDACSIPYLITWNSIKNKKKTGIFSILCEFWRLQEKWDGCKRDSYGCITDIERACTFVEQSKLLANKGDAIISPSVLVMIWSVRPKIYAIIYSLQERHQDITKIVQEQYGIDLKANLSAEDEITLILINGFYRLKFGELWQEIDGDYLCRRPPHKITPIYRDIIHKLSLRSMHWANYFRSEQESIVQKHNDEILKEEEDFYTIHNDSQIAPAMKALREICFNARIENRDFLANVKQKMATQIQKCREETGLLCGVPLYPQNLNITTMSAVRKPILMHSHYKGHQGCFSHVRQEVKLEDIMRDSISSQRSSQTVNHLTDHLYEDAVKDESLLQKTFNDQNKKK